MELRQLRYFVTVADTLHFGRAAELLHLAQPAVSQQIRRLERELGAELFDRSPRHVRLTEAGEHFLPAARSVLAAEEHARSVINELVRPRQRTLRIGTSAGLGDHLDRLLDQLTGKSPELAVDLVSAPVQERLRQVAEGRLDAAFVRGGSQEQREQGPAGLRTVEVWRDPLVAALPARHPLAARPAVDLADLAGLRLALTPRRNHPSLVDLVVGACAAAGFEPLPSTGAGTLQDTLSAIGAGQSLWTVVYAAHARLLRGERVAFLPFRDADLALTTSLVVRATAPTPQVRLLLAACEASTSDDNDR
ncbi:LysR family transcriptional regulator [Streptacidiphilus sp. P02-A3a]|uniref:LysR family transcriptional regulator n=1 Tax=Streptacidiphilus sp. P02-A3a TaxID=2704468 RepID=UPI0015FC9254|nr:LysR family transcriptional regulator [Streptacidiphilus sp. P02-A3a]QMU72063.1 LysR family transcriptional regulator [Streptacidiphilus sp. P02-A3a]